MIDSTRWRQLRTGSIAVAAVLAVIVWPLGEPVGAAIVSAVAGTSLALLARRGGPMRSAWLWLAAGAILLTAQISMVSFGVRFDQRTLHESIAPFASTGAVIVTMVGLLLAYRPAFLDRRSRPIALRFSLVTVVGVSTFTFSDPKFSASLPAWVAVAACTIAVVVAGLVLWCLAGLRATGCVSDGLVAITEAQAAMYVLAAVDIADHRFWAVSGPVLFVLLAIAGRSGRWSVPRVLHTRLRPDIRWFAMVGTVIGSIIPISRLGWSPAALSAAYVAGVLLTLWVFGRRLARTWTGGMVDAPDRLRAIAGSLPHALTTRGIDVFVQPIVRVGDRRLAGFEALMRWNDDRLGTVDPAAASAAAGWVGMSQALDRYMLDAVGRHVARLLGGLRVDEGMVTVNVSPASIQDPEFADWLLDHFATERWPLDGLVLEILEQGAVEDWPALRANVERLQHAGVAIALDDFGEGGSNLRYLTEIEPDIVKLDKSLVRWAHTVAGRNLLADTIALVRGRGCRVVVEGIEHAETLATVTALGVDYVQGFAIGRPRPLPAWEPTSPAAVTLRGRVSRNLDAVVGDTDAVQVTADALVLRRHHETIEIPRDALVSLKLESGRTPLRRRCALSLHFVSPAAGRLDSVSFTSNERRHLARALSAHGWV